LPGGCQVARMRALKMEFIIALRGLGVGQNLMVKAGQFWMAINKPFVGVTLNQLNFSSLIYMGKY